MRYDVMVLGGGIVGASTAYSLAKQGNAVLLIDQFKPGHLHGSSHGDGRVVRFNYTEAIYIEMAQLVYPAWQALSDAAGIPLIQETGLLEYGPKDCAPIDATAKLFDDLNIPYERFAVEDVVNRFPQYRFAAHTQLLYQKAGAVAFATPAVRALWKLTEDLGGKTINQRITQIDVGETITLSNKMGDTWTGNKLVMATGGWSAKIAEMLELALPLEITQEVLAYFPVQNERINHTIGHMPVMIDYHDLANPFYTLPQVDVPGVKVGWHHVGTETDADARTAASPHILEGIQGWVSQIYPHLLPDPIQVDTCLYSNTPDYHFVLDHHPTYDNVVIGAGFSGHGFKFGPVLGDLLAALALDEAPAIALDAFRIGRFAEGNLEKRLGA